MHVMHLGPLAEVAYDLLFYWLFGSFTIKFVGWWWCGDVAVGLAMINNIIKMEIDSADITLQTLPDQVLESPNDQVIRLSRFSAPSKKNKNKLHKQSSALDGEKIEKEADEAKKEERIRLAAKGVRQPVMGELSSSKILQGLR